MDLPFYTANVLVSTSKKDIDTIFLNPDSSLSPKKKSISELIGDSKSTFLFAPGVDSGLIRLTDSFLYTGSPLITLEFVDPGKDFENALLQKDLSDTLKSVMSVPDIQPPVPYKKKKKTADEIIIDKIGDIANSRDLALKNLVPPMDLIKTGEAIESSTWTQHRPPKGPKDKAIDDLIGADAPLTENVYIAYGDGVDTSKWTVQSGKLIDATMSVAKGSREITLKFIPSFDSLTIEQLMEDNKIENPPLNVKGVTRNITAKTDKQLVEYFKITGQYGYHELFVDIMTNYLETVTNLKALVFLPDADVVFSNHLKIIESTTKVEWKPSDELKVRDMGLSDGAVGYLKNKEKYNAFLNRFGIYLNDKASDKFLSNAYVIADKVSETIDTSWFPRINTTVNSDTLNEAYRKVLRTFESPYNATDYHPRWDLHVQNNMKILKIWHEELAIGNGVDPIVVYGDRRLIDQYLYFSNKYKEDGAIGDEVLNSFVQTKTRSVKTKVGEEWISAGTAGGQGVAVSKYEMKDEPYEEVTLSDLTHAQKKAAIDFLLHEAESRGADKTIINSLKEKLDKLKAGDTPGFPKNIIRASDKEKYDVIKKSMIDFNKNHLREQADPRTLKERNITNAILDLADTYGFPIFRSNTASVSDNIKSIDLNLHKFYWASLSSGYKASTVPRLAAALAKDEDKVKELYGDLIGDATAVIECLIQANEHDVAEYLMKDKELQKRFKTKFGQESKNYPLFVFTAMFMSMNKVASTMTLPSNNTANPISIQMHVLEKLATMAYEVTIETTPMFHLAGSHSKFKSCLLLSNDFDIHGVLKKEVKFRRDQVHDGVYIIFGYEHIISASEVSSKFNLTRLPSSA